MMKIQILLTIYTMIKLFSSVSCVSCKQLKKYLDSKGIEYVIVDIEQNIKEAKDNKIKCLPTIIFDQDKRIEGFDLKKIKELLV